MESSVKDLPPLGRLKTSKIAKQGWIRKEGGSVKTWKKRWLVLVGDHLYYFSSDKRTANAKGVIFMEIRHIVSMTEQDTEQFCNNGEAGIELCPDYGHSEMRTYRIVFPSSEDKYEWIQIIKKAKYWNYVAILARYWLFKTRFRRRWSAALVIQNAMKKRQDSRNKAALVIQKNFRMHREKTQFEKTMGAIARINRYVRMWRVRQMYKEKQGAITKIQALYRGWKARKNVVIYRAMFERREKIVNEIASTETSYLESLHILKKVFYDQLTNKILNMEESRRIFSNIPEIHDQHESIALVLQTRIEEWNRRMKIGDIFFGLNAFIPRVYPRYLNNFEESMRTTLILRKKKPAFRKFLEEKMEDFEACKGLDLASYLIMPVQRIPRYVLLLNDLVKHTPDWHRDYDDLKRALQSVQETADYVNKCKGQAENAARIVEIQNSIASKKGMPNLSNEGKFERVFLHEGLLQKKPSGGNVGKSHTRHFFLFSDFILYCEKKLIPKGGKKYDFKGFIPLEAASVKNYEGDKSVPHGFEILTRRGRYVIYADDAETKQKWMDKIAHAVDLYHRKLFGLEGIEVAEGHFRCDTTKLNRCNSASEGVDEDDHDNDENDEEEIVINSNEDNNTNINDDDESQLDQMRMIAELASGCDLANDFEADGEGGWL